MAEGNGRYINPKLQMLQSYVDKTKDEIIDEVLKVKAEIDTKNISDELREIKEILKDNSKKHYDLLRIAVLSLILIAVGSKAIEFLK